ncbi:T9SS type A sorting domain-containing protein, partial [bacterium]|nr:T9SS type A sorting domain-containing protein [bacterium]
LPVLALMLLPFGARPVAAQNPGPGDWGDAPEGAIAYPALGVGGLFPTCFGGPAAFVWHGNPGAANDMYWGPTVDTEFDGNANFCPPPNYEQDECWGPFDGDGGLTVPDTYSIAAGVVVPCGQVPPMPLGAPCQMVAVGGSFDANLVNNTPLDGFANVIFDWNQDGRWGGASACPGGFTSEHAIVNVPVPAGYVGPLSGLFVGAFRIGPNAGYVWARLTLSESPVPANWAGEGLFDLGESEDYLLRINEGQDEVGEYGDAPEGVLAYPGVIGDFPTCLGGPNGFVYHAPVDLVFFGPTLDWEIDGNAGICPPPAYDRDECNGAAGDGGILMPMPLTLTAAAVPTACPNGAVGPDLVGCLTVRWGVHMDIEVHNFTNEDRYANVLADWDGDGKWTPAVQVCPNGILVPEHVLVDFVVPAGFSGPLSALFPPDFTAGVPADGLSWFRFTISDVPVAPQWDGQGQFGDGETEDYLFRIAQPPVDAPELGGADARALGLRIASVSPNPMTHAATVQLASGRSGWTRVKVYDAAGRNVATLADEWIAAGEHEVTWDGRDAANREATPGVYFVRATQAGESVTAKVVRMR